MYMSLSPKEAKSIVYSDASLFLIYNAQMGNKEVSSFSITHSAAMGSQILTLDLLNSFNGTIHLLVLALSILVISK